MTRTALGIAVCALLCWPACGRAEPTPAPEPAVAQQDTKPAEPPLALGQKRIGMLDVTPAQKRQLSDNVGQEQAEVVVDAFDKVNKARAEAETHAQKTGKSEKEQLDAVARDPKVVAAVQAAGSAVADAKVPSALREKVSTVLNTTGQHQQAADLSEQTLAREPDNRDALNNISQARFSLGQYRQAIESATRLMQREPSSEAAYTTRALSRYYSGEYVLAAEDAQRALALNKNNDIAVATLRMSQTRLAAAPLKLDAVAATQAEKIKAEYQASLEQRNEAAAARPSVLPSADPLRQRTAAKISTGDQLGAVADATRAIEHDPNNAEAWYLRAAARNQIGEHGLAIQDATQALRLVPGHALAYGARARAKLSTGLLREAADDATRSIELDPTNAYAFAVRARAFEKLGNFAATLADLSQAARINRQFEPEYQRAATRHALPPAPGPESNSSRSAAPERGADSGGRSTLMLTLLTVVGGCLIAVGLMSFASMAANRKVTTAIKRLEEARVAMTPPSQGVTSLPSHFRVVRAIGRGGMGVVYEAMDDALNRRVALKKMRDEIRVDPHERDRFLQEARTVAALHHPNIVDIYSIVEEGGELCLVFEHVSGRTVEQLLETKGRLSIPEARHIVRGICKALDYAHKRGVVHRDLKPSNVMLADDHDVKVMDFGIARHAKDALSRMTVTNTVAGTPPYMAPEADQGVVRPETDIYALGACLYEMLTGERPFPNSANTSAKLSMSFQRPTTVRRDLPPAIDALIEAALQPDPDKRIQTPGDFFVRFEQAVSVPAS